MKVKVAEVASDSSRPHGLVCQAPLSVEFSRPEYRSGLLFPSPGDLPDPGIELRSPILQLDYLPCEPPGKPKNTGVGSLSLLQEIFPTQGSNPGLPHCFRILYHLRTREAPNWNEAVVKTRAVADFIFLAPKSLQVVTAALKLKDSSSLQGKL